MVTTTETRRCGASMYRCSSCDEATAEVFDACLKCGSGGQVGLVDHAAVAAGVWACS